MHNAAKSIFQSVGGEEERINDEGDQGRAADGWRLVCVCASERVCKNQTCSRASYLPAGIVLDPAVCVCVGQFGRGARPADSKTMQSVHCDAPFNYLIISNKKRDCRKAKEIIHRYDINIIIIITKYLL